MNIERFHPSRLAELPTSRRYDLAIVIDVLRASSTAAVLLERCEELAVVSELAAIPALPARSWLVVSELDGAGAFGPTIDNSPVTAAQVSVDDRTPCLVTTNGTRTLCAAAMHADVVVMAGLVNLAALAALAVRQAPSSVVVLPSGSFASGEAHLEDELCADAVIARLGGRAFDVSQVPARVRGEPRVARRLAREAMLSADVDLSLSIDRCRWVGVFTASDVRSGWLRRG